MSVNLVEQLEQYLSPDVVANLAATLGEAPDHTIAAVNSALPSLLAGLADKSDDTNAIANLYHLIVNENLDGGVLSNLGALSRGGAETEDLIAKGGKMLSGIFGDKAAGITDLIANVGGLGKNAAGSLLGFLTPVVLSLIGKTLKLQKQTSAEGLATLLSDHSSLLPAGLGGLFAAEAVQSTKVGEDSPLDKVLNTLDFEPAKEKAGAVKNAIEDAFERIEDKVEDVAHDTFTSVKNAAAEASETVAHFSEKAVDEGKDFAKSAAAAFDETAEENGSKILPWFLIAAALALLWGILKSCSTEEKAPEKPVAETSAPAPVPAQPNTAEVPPAAPPVTSAPSEPVKTAPPASAESKFFERDLPTGFHIQGVKEGVESKLISFIESNEPVSENLWFNMEGIQFDTAKATIRPESAAQITNIAEIMKAFPNVKIKIGGYTDNTGKAASNLKLSSNRANAVKKALAKQGVAAARVTAEGYGSEHPVASNDTEAGRQQNRRIDVRVTQK